MNTQNNFGLYDASFEHDSCGIGFAANTKGIKSHQPISDTCTHLRFCDSPYRLIVKKNF